MGVTRKERLLKAMLEDNSAACGCGVTREEKMLAGVARKACENDVLDGGGGGDGGELILELSEDRKTVLTPREEYVAAFHAGRTVKLCNPYNAWGLMFHMPCICISSSAQFGAVDLTISSGSVSGCRYMYANVELSTGKITFGKYDLSTKT